MSKTRSYKKRRSEQNLFEQLDERFDETFDEPFDKQLDKQSDKSTNMSANVDISIPIPQSKFTRELGLSLESGEFSDVKVIADDSEFFAHKIMLAARSPVFKAMFNHDSKENTENVVNITDFDADVVQNILTYIYTDNVDLHGKPEDARRQLYQAADKYQLGRLKSMCEDILSKSLTIENAVETLILADLHSSLVLKEKIFDFFNEEVEEISKMESWAKLLDCPKLLNDLYLAHSRYKKKQAEHKQHVCQHCRRYCC